MSQGNRGDINTEAAIRDKKKLMGTDAAFRLITNDKRQPAVFVSGSTQSPKGLELIDFLISRKHNVGHFLPNMEIVEDTAKAIVLLLADEKGISKRDIGESVGQRQLLFFKLQERSNPAAYVALGMVLRTFTAEKILVIVEKELKVPANVTGTKIVVFDEANLWQQAVISFLESAD